MTPWDRLATFFARRGYQLGKPDGWENAPVEHRRFSLAVLLFYGCLGLAFYVVEFMSDEPDPADRPVAVEGGR